MSFSQQSRPLRRESSRTRADSGTRYRHRPRVARMHRPTPEPVGLVSQQAVQLGFKRRNGSPYWTKGQLDKQLAAAQYPDVLSPTIVPGHRNPARILPSGESHPEGTVPAAARETGLGQATSNAPGKRLGTTQGEETIHVS